MTLRRISVSTFAALLAALIYFTSDPGTILALLLPMAVHELGHVCALLLLGCRIAGFRAELRGFCIEYGGYTGDLGEALAAAAGPAAGLLYALVCSALGRDGGAWFQLTAGASLLLSIFNLLPASPLDGGRIFRALAYMLLGDEIGERLAVRVGFLTGAALLGLGFWLALSDKGLAILGAAIWILLFQSEPGGLVKKREVL